MADRKAHFAEFKKDGEEKVRETLARNGYPRVKAGDAQFWLDRQSRRRDNTRHAILIPAAVVATIAALITIAISAKPIIQWLSK